MADNLVSEHSTTFQEALQTNLSNMYLHASSCEFSKISYIGDVLRVFKNPSCYRHSPLFTGFLFAANIVIFLFGLLGNTLVVYVVTRKIKTKTVSTIFILNLAVADLLVILCCIPANLLANIFTRKLLSKKLSARMVLLFISMHENFTDYFFFTFSLDLRRRSLQTCSLCPGRFSILLCVLASGHFL